LIAQAGPATFAHTPEFKIELWSLRWSALSAALLTRAATMPQMPPPTVTLIAAVARNRAIGKDNALLVHLEGDLPRFKRLTLGGAIVMGRKTWDSIGRPLPGRRNIVLTRDPHWQAAGAEAAPSLQAALTLTLGAPKVFVIGGAQAYAEALPIADELILTEIDADLPGDAYFPDWDKSKFVEVSRQAASDKGGLKFSFVTYARRRGD
jgi:dihydrofolate reductase